MEFHVPLILSKCKIYLSKKSVHILLGQPVCCSAQFPVFASKISYEKISVCILCVDLRQIVSPYLLQKEKLLYNICFKTWRSQPYVTPFKHLTRVPRRVHISLFTFPCLHCLLLLTRCLFVYYVLEHLYLLYTGMTCIQILPIQTPVIRVQERVTFLNTSKGVLIHSQCRP